MRKPVFLMAVLLLSAVWVVAQTAGTAQAGTPAQSPSQNSSTPQSSGTAQNPQPQTGTNPPGTTSATPNPQTTPSTPATGATGQTGAAATPPGTTPQTATGPQTTVEGCLSGTPGEYSLITKSGQVYSLAGDDSLLGNHVGEEVRVTGAQSNSSAAGASAPSATPGNSA